MASARDFAGKMLFWAAMAVSVLMVLGVFTPRENRILKSAFPELSAVTSGTSRDKRIVASPKKFQERLAASFRRPAAVDREIDWQAVGMIRAKFGHIIKEASAAHGVSPVVITAIILVESSGNPFEEHPESHAKGLMQITDITAQEFGIGNVFDPRENILGGTKVFAIYRQKVGGSFDRALVAYNAGPYSNLLNKPDFDPAQHEYVRRVKRTIAYLSA